MITATENPQGLSDKTPAQVLESFFENNSVDQLKLTLLATLQGYALNERKGFLKLNVSEEQITEVFDSLVGLVGAVETLIEEGKIEGLKA